MYTKIILQNFIVMLVENKLKIYKAFLSVLSVLCVVMALFIILDNKTSQNASKVANIKSIDTVVVRDTLRIEVPVEKIVYKDRKVVDTLYLQTPQDTTPLPIEQKIYEDRFIISAGVYTGYSPIYKNFDVIVGFGVGIRLGK